MTADSGASGGTAPVVVVAGVVVGVDPSAGTAVGGGGSVVGGTMVVVGCSDPGRTATTARDS